jgi:hypothetical protein
VRPLRSVEGKEGMFVVSLCGGEVLLLGCVFVGGLLKGRVDGRLESLENGEGPCALVRAQERIRSIYESKSGEAFFIDVE